MMVADVMTGGLVGEVACEIPGVLGEAGCWIGVGVVCCL